MDGLLKQHVFDRQNVGLCFLSPYVKVVKTENGLFIGRPESERGIILTNDAETFVFLKELANGITEEAFAKFVTTKFGENENVEEWYACFLQEGIIE